MFKTALAAAALAAAFAPAHALGTGDLAFTGFNADKDHWAVIALADVAAGTEVYFSDNEWNGASFNDLNEHTMLWNTGASTIAAGTVVLFTEIGSSDFSVSIGSLSLAAGGGSNFGLSASDETIYAFLGTGAAAPTTFLAGFSTETDAGRLTAAGLTLGVNALQVTNSADYAEYTGPRSGATAFAAYGAMVNDAANWNVIVGGDQSALVPDTTAFTVTPVPEPGTYGMLLAGLAAVGTFVRRRRA